MVLENFLGAPVRPASRQAFAGRFPKPFGLRRASTTAQSLAHIPA